MDKNLTSQQLVLIALAAILLLLAAMAFYLLQDPNASLPFIPATPSYTATQMPAASSTPLTATPTRRTSYTPFASTLTPQYGTPNQPPVQTVTTPPALSTPSPGGTTPRTPSPSATATLPRPSPSSTRGATVTGTPPTPTATTAKTPTVTATLAAGEISVTGRIIQNATPVANVVMTFADDAAPRQSTTDSGGHYSFVTLAPGTDFILTFDQADNLNLSPAAEIASLILVEGILPTGADPIDIPGIELSLNLDGILFEPQSPIDGASFSASAINSSNPILFIWTLYSLGGSYHVEVGSNGNDEPIWTSALITASNYTWDGTLSDGSHITQGSYWWRVSVTKSLGNYVEVIYTQRYDIIFTQ
jgi:hypothetical protein